jgi:hypothetical protein
VEKHENWGVCKRGVLFVSKKLEGLPSRKSVPKMSSFCLSEEPYATSNWQGISFLVVALAGRKISRGLDRKEMLP